MCENGRTRREGSGAKACHLFSDFITPLLENGFWRAAVIVGGRRGSDSFGLVTLECFLRVAEEICPRSGGEMPPPPPSLVRGYVHLQSRTDSPDGQSHFENEREGNWRSG